MAEQETKSLQVIVKESGLEGSKSKELLDNFSGYFDMAAEWEQKAKGITVTDATQVAEMKMAREGRLFLREKRIAVENTRKKMKEQSLREGKAIDGIANVLKALIVPIEEHLDEQEHFAERKRKAEEEARQLEAEKLLREKEENERLKREAAELRVREENERLKREAEEREAKGKKEREAAKRKLAREKAASETKLQAERDARDRELAEERQKAAAKQKAIDEKARKQREADKRKADKEAAQKAKEYEAKLAEERLRASMVICPECGAEFSTEGDS